MSGRLQTCEKRIIELVNWDAEYFYDESLSYEEIDQLKALLKKRQRILNKMCVYTDNEIKRLEELNAMFIDAIRQMNQDLGNLHDGRMNMPNIEQYNDLITTALRTREGIDIDSLSETDKLFLTKAASKSIEQGNLIIEHNHLHLTRKGLFISDAVMVELIK